MGVIKNINPETQDGRCSLAHLSFYFPRREPGNNYRVEMDYKIDELLDDKELPAYKSKAGFSVWTFKICKIIDGEMRKRGISVDDVTLAFSKARNQNGGYSSNPRDFEALYNVIAPIYEGLLNSSQLNDLEKHALTS